MDDRRRERIPDDATEARLPEDGGTCDRSGEDGGRAFDQPPEADGPTYDRPLGTADPSGRPLSRRRFLQWSAVAGTVLLAACGPEEPSRPAATPITAPTDAPPEPSPTPSATASPSESAASDQAVTKTLYRDGALADGRADRLRLGVSILVEDGRIRWIRPSDDEGADTKGSHIIDASGSTFVPGMVDAHSHITLPGGAHWIDRGFDPPERMLEAAERNAGLLTGAGVRWARDVGSPIVRDPLDGQTRGLAIGVRERWRDKAGYPYVRAAGSWVTRKGTLPAGLTAEARDADELLALALAQLDDGADLVKLYLDGPDPGTSPWSVAEVSRVVKAVHGRGARVTAHSGHLAGARVGAEAAVDALEHGWELDAAVARTMATSGVALVTTLTVMRSWLSFSRTTNIPRFASTDGRRAVLARLERAEASVMAAKRAGVKIAAGTDFGGGSSRANQLPWEVESLVAAGLEPWEALASATWRGGELLGDEGAGVIREGGPADFCLVHGDPLSDPRAMWRVWWVAWVA